MTSYYMRQNPSIKIDPVVKSDDAERERGTNWSFNKYKFDNWWHSQSEIFFFFFSKLIQIHYAEIEIAFEWN